MNKIRRRYLGPLHTSFDFETPYLEEVPAPVRTADRSVQLTGLAIKAGARALFAAREIRLRALLGDTTLVVGALGRVGTSTSTSTSHF